MGQPFTISQAQPADLADVGRLFAAYAASLPIDLAYQDFAAELAGLPGAYAPPRGALLMARDPDGVAIGCVAMRPLAPKTADAIAEMKRLYVVREATGHGLGRALAEAVVAAARTAGYRAMRLDTLDSLAPARGLYASMGFTPTSAYYAGAVPGTVFYELNL